MVVVDDGGADVDAGTTRGVDVDAAVVEMFPEDAGEGRGSEGEDRRRQGRRFSTENRS